MLMSKPFSIRNIVDNTAQYRVFEMRMAVYETRHDGCTAEIAYLLFGVAGFHTLGTAYFNDAPVAHQNRAIVDRRLRDGDDMFSTQ